LFVCHHNKHSITINNAIICQVANCFEHWRFFHCEQFSFKAHFVLCLFVLIFAIFVGTTSFKCSVSFILNIFIIVWLHLLCQNVICNTFWTVALVRYYGNLKWCRSYIVGHKPIKRKHLMGNKLYFTTILTDIQIEGKWKSYKHSLIIYWTALVYVTSYEGHITHLFQLFASGQKLFTFKL